MAEKIPTFRSESVTRSANVPMVRASGLDAQSQMFGQIGNVFQGVADYANEKLLQKAIREQQELAVETVTSEGFDPRELKGQQINTIADEAYRKAAIEAYGYELDTRIDTTIKQAYADNLENPNGFLRATEGFEKGIVESVPFEMKAGAKAAIQTKINSFHTEMQVAQQRRLMAERDEARKIFADKAVNDAILADSPEETAIALSRMASVINQQFDTPERREAEMMKVKMRVAEQKLDVDVMKGLLSPDDWMATMNELGIAPDANDYNRAINLYNQGRGLELQSLADEEGKEKQVAESSKDALALQVAQMRQEEKSPTEIQSFIDQTFIQNVSSGMDVDAANSVKKSAMTMVMNEDISPAAKAQSYLNVENAIGQDDFDKIAKQTLLLQGIARSEYDALTKRHNEAIAQPFESHPHLKPAMDRLIAVKYPIFASYRNSQNPPKLEPGVDVDLVAGYQEQQGAAGADIARFQQMLNTDMSEAQVSAIILNEKQQYESDKETLKINRAIAQLPTYRNAAAGAQRILNSNNLFSNDKRLKDAFDGEWTRDNAENRLSRLRHYYAPKGNSSEEMKQVYIIELTLKKDGWLQNVQ